MDSQISALHRKIQRQEITVEEAAQAFERIRARYRREGQARAILAPSADQAPVAVVRYRHDDPYLRDHRFDDQRILLGLTAASLALGQGIGQLAAGEAVQVKALAFAAPVIVAPGEAVEVAIRGGAVAGAFEAICRHDPEGPWQTMASGELRAVQAEPRLVELEALRDGMQAMEPIASIYRICERMHIGDSFRTLDALYRHPAAAETLARVALRDGTVDDVPYPLHPLWLNSAFLAVIPLLEAARLDEPFIPFGARSLLLHRRDVPVTGWVHARLVKHTGELVLFDADLYDDQGALIAELEGCSLKRLREDRIEVTEQDVEKTPHATATAATCSGPDVIEDYLQVQLQALGAARIGRQHRRRNLMELGLDSAQLVDLAARIGRDAAVDLEPTLFFEYPSLAELAEFLWQAHGDAFAARSGNSESTASELPRSAEPAPQGPVHAPAAGEGDQDIAIIGMQGRFAQAENLDQFWEHLRDDRELIGEVPMDHWDVRPWFDADPDAQDRTYSKWGSFLDDVDKFDAGFFHMSRREAQWMDPQVRLLLQSAYACAEGAGVIQGLRGSRTGVFIGSCFNEYLDRISELGLPMDPYIATGSGVIAANRISFWFDFKGPSLMFNTACSSSLVALHAACVSLRNGECEMAFVGGSNLLLSSWHYRYFSAIRALSPSGRCHTFDARADGYVPGECVATLLLKPLSLALADGDPIHGVVKGSAALHGGYTPSLTAPSVAGEENVIVQAWQSAGIDPRSLGYIEAHGTGTALGDPIEINALKRAFARYTQDRGFCQIGSVKANIGHAEGAAGIAGVLKVLQQMKHRQHPALGHFRELNPHIHLDDSPLVIDPQGGEWPEQDTPRRAGVSSFGFSGTNAHVVLEEFRERRTFASHQGETVLVPLSARNDERLRDQVARLHAYLEDHTPDLAALAYTLQTGREAMAARAVFPAASLAALREQLQAWLRGEGPTACVTPTLGIDEALASADLQQLAAHWRLGEEGETLDWNRLYEGRPSPARIELPTYAFARDRYWLEAPETGPSEKPALEAPGVSVDSHRPAAHQPEANLSEASLPETHQPEADRTLAIYTEHWQPVEEASEGVSPECVVCLLGDRELRRRLAACVAERSPRTRLVFIAAGERDGRDEEGHHQVAVDDPRRLRDSLHRILSAQGGGRVLYLWSLDSPRWLSDTRGIVALVKALSGGAGHWDRLVLAGRAGDALARCHLDAWIGIERSLGAVMPHCPVEVAIELADGAGSEARWPDRFWRQLCSSVPGSRLYQGAQAFRSMLVPTRLQAAADPLTPDRLKTVLITGGLGELGLMLAGELSRRARHPAAPINLILNGRLAPSAATHARLEALRHDGCRVFHLQADCTDHQELAAALATVLPLSGPIDGLIHAAGLKATGSLLDSAQADIDAVLDAKVKSVQVLDEVLVGQPLALICHFASSSAVLGDMGACSYAMANRFLQAYARHVQEGRARRVVAIDWPLWRNGGMAMGDTTSTAFYLGSSGQRLLEDEEGLALLWRIIASDIAQPLVLAGDPDRLDRWVAGMNRPADQKAPAEGPVVAEAGAGRERPELKGLTLRQALLWDLQELASRPLQAERQALGETTNLADFGFDSISLAEYARLLSRHFGLSLTPELFFNHSSLGRIADHLLARYPDAMTACYRSGAAASAPVVAPAVPAGEPGRAAAVPVNDDAIAIIGLSGRFPGARDPDAFWTVLAEGLDQVGEIPADRFAWRDYYGDHREDPSKTRCIWMGSVPGVAEFDPLFFELSPREAKAMDPRQRLLLQEAWNALENAGIGPRHLATQRVGTFVGVEEGDFQRLAGEESLTSSHNGILAARLAYFLDLTGPTLAINTACSSALVALHQAASSLRNGECELAIAAGVNLIFSPDAFLGMTQAGMLSPDGKCFTFDRRANGMVPGEAVCCVVLKPLAQAQADGDWIHGVLRGSGINYDGKTNGITAPSGLSQQRLLEDVYRRAGVDPEQIEYVVTHGTGTQLGDPVEINALNDAFRGSRPGHCALTSTKTNVGHTFAASGLVSVIGLLQAFRHETIPASLHCEQENDYIQWQQSPFYVNKANRPWPAAGRDRERLGAVSAFGMSGTNAHVVLESHARGTVDALALRRPCYLLVLSAKTADALRERAEQLCTVLEQDGFDEDDLPGISYTLLEGRHHFRHRLALVAADREEARYGLRQYLAGEQRPSLFAGEVERGFAPQKTLERYLGQAQDDSATATDEETLRELLQGLADLFRQGYGVDGARLFGAGSRPLPQRLPLPGYPFARDRYWPEVRTPRRSPVADQHLHPLLHRNVSTVSATRFASRFSGRETFLADHRIGDQRVFPGTAYLELAREAVVRASERAPDQIGLRNLVWLRPLSLAVSDDQGFTLYCELAVNGADGLSFKVYSLGEGREHLHVQGDADLDAGETPPAALDLSRLAARCNLSERDHDTLYSDFERLGVHYGATFRAAGHIRIGRDLVVGQLSADALDPQLEGAALPPGILDSALHIAASLGSWRDGSAEPALPFALDRLRVHGSLESALRTGPLTVVAGYRDGQSGGPVEKVDVQICTANGECLAQLDGFSSRRQAQAVIQTSPPAVSPTVLEVPVGRLIREPYWAPLEETGEPVPDTAPWHVLLLGLPEAVGTAVRGQLGDRVRQLPGAVGDNGAKAYARAAQALLEFLKTCREGYVQLFVGQEPDDLRMAGLDGMLSTAMIEHSELKARLVILDRDMGEAALVRTVVDQARRYRPGLVRILATGSPYGRAWREWTSVPLPADDPAPFRDAGVYAITGGAGGLGLLFAERIAGCCRAPSIHLAGRSALGEALQARLERLRALGAQVHYRVLDVAQPVAVGDWIEGIYAEHGQLHGVIHGAGSLRDGLILHKTAEDLEQVLSAKVAGIEALDAAIGERPLDFLVCCSSQAAMGNLGQADYAVANAYLDAFMQYRQKRAADGQRRGRSLSIDWPLWRDGGMQLPAVIEQQMRERFGIVPLPAVEGFDSLRELLARSVSAQAWVVYGDVQRLGQIGLASRALPAAPAPRPANAVAPVLGEAELKGRIQTFVTGIVAKVTQLDPAKIHPAEKFEAYGFDSIMAVGVTQELERHLGSLPKTLLFEHVNVAGLVAHLAVKYREVFVAMFAPEHVPSAALAPEPSVATAPGHPAPSVPDSSTPRDVSTPGVASAGDGRIEDEDWKNHVAVIGLGGYYPGAKDMDTLWRNLAEGVDCMSEFPAERWDHHKLYYKNRSVLGKTTCLNGSFIEDVDAFDYSYFKMPKVYADHMSPEVRLFLQVAVHTFEDAGYSRETLLNRYGGDVGVLLGTMSNDYHYYGFENNVFRGSMASGSGMATIPMTVSYFYGLTGPSLFIDTMCSSSSTCIHTAYQMLRHGETQMVLAGGLNLMYHPYTVVNTSQGNFTSITSSSVNSYGVGADGTVIGEGVGAVLLKRLDRALADRDHIYGVIKGSAITNAGERNGFNVPNPDLQTLAIRQAMDQARVHPASISYVEGHGSGTKLGDPIEVLGLTKAFRAGTEDRQFCYLGSIKSNIGHLLAASGIAGLTKTLLQLKHGQIAPSIHSAHLNPDIDFAETPFMIPQRLTEWRRPERTIDGQRQVFPRRAGLTSIAAGGMNAHLIVEEYPELADSAGQVQDDHLAFVFSVHKLSVLTQNLQAFRDWLATREVPLSQVAYTLQVGRNNLRNRLAIRCRSRQALLDALDACLAGRFEATATWEAAFRFPENDTAQALARPASNPVDASLARWLEGDNAVDWERLYARVPVRTSLPVYRFEKTRCWYTEEGYESPILNPQMFAAKLHPLVAENCSTPEPGARFRTDFVEAELLDYCYRGATGLRFSAFNFTDVALAMPGLASRFPGRELVVSCAFEHYIADWSTVTGLAYRLYDVDDGQLELEFDAQRAEGAINLGFAILNPLGDDEPPLPQGWLDEAGRLLNRQAIPASGQLAAPEVSQRLARSGYEFGPYLDDTGDAVIGHRALLLEARPPANRHNPHGDNQQVPPWVATSVDKALYLLLDTLGLPQGRLVVRSIERLCSYRVPEGPVSVVLSDLVLGEDDLSLRLLVLDAQAQVCIKADRIGLHLGEAERAALDRRHPLLTGMDASATQTALPVANAQEALEPAGAGLGERVLAFIQQELQDKLGFAVQEIGESAQVHDLGLDSIMVMQLADSVNKRFGTRLMPDLFYEKQRLGELAARVEVV